MPTPGFDIVQSNRTERLAERLSEDLAEHPLASPFTKEIILVQDPSVGRWLEMFLARTSGIAANLRFLNPPQFAADLYRSLDPSLRTGSPYDPEVLQWKLFSFLEDRSFTGEFPELTAYVKSGDRGRIFDLSARIAETFSRYLVYRMDWLADWESRKEGKRGKDELWQAALWRKVTETTTEPHHGTLFKQLLDAIEQRRIALPERISVFGISSLSPAYAALLQASGRHAAVRLYVMNPCREEWGEIVSERTLADLDFSPELLHFDVPHALLGSLGKQGRDFMAIVYEQEGKGSGTTDLFESPGEDTLLHVLQSGVLNLTEGKYRCRTGDDSIQVHRCHTPMREVQVLRDRLLDLFAHDPTLKASDIMVLAPDINAYAPYIDAVFASPRGDGVNIPHEIADRIPAQMDPVVEAWLALLELQRSRFEAETVVGLLRLPPLGSAFGIGTEEIGRLAEWVERSGIRWGIDGSQKRTLGFPANEEFSWTWGLDRLALGVALPQAPGTLFHGYLPCTLVEGEEIDLLDRFIRFMATLKEWTEFLGTPRSAENWGESLGRWLDRFFPGGREISEQREGLRSVIQAAFAGGARAAFGEPVEYSVVRRVLLAALGEDREGLRFSSGGVVFCSMRPMRALPFRVICLLGISDGAFPRERRAPGFDLMKKFYRHGDRSGRQDDRYLFLELLLSAREKFVVSYVGEDVYTGKNLPPSPILGELLDFIGRVAFAVPADGSDKRTPRERAEAAILVRHPLQSFSAKYFDGSDAGLFSYSEVDRRTCAAILAGAAEAQPLFPGALPPLAGMRRKVVLDDLCAFFRNPAKTLLNTRLSVFYRTEDDTLEDAEPLVVGKAEARSIRRALIRSTGEGELRTPDDELNIFRQMCADARLPVGLPGSSGFSAEVREMSPILSAYRALLEQQRIPGIAQTLTLDGWEIEIDESRGLTVEGMFHAKPGELRGRDILPFWIKTLAISLVHPNSGTFTGTLLGINRNRAGELQPELLTFTQEANASELLGALLRWYAVGLTRPIRFFPNSLWEYAKGYGPNRDRETAFGKALTAWAGDERGHPERDDEYFGRLFPPDETALDEEFLQLAELVAVRAFASLVVREKPARRRKKP